MLERLKSAARILLPLVVLGVAGFALTRELSGFHSCWRRRGSGPLSPEARYSPSPRIRYSVFRSIPSTSAAFVLFPAHSPSTSVA